MDKQEMVDKMRQKLWQKGTGYQTSIEVIPGGQQNGLDYGPVEIRIVVLDTDGTTVAYGYEDDNSGPFWEVGTIEDAVEEAITVKAEIVAGEPVWEGIEDD